MEKISKNNREDKSLKQEIQYNEIKDFLQPFADLEKPYYDGPDGMRKAIHDCNLSDDLSKKLSKLTSRDGLHILRMLKHSNTERDFAIAYLKYRDDVLVKKGGPLSKIVCVINSEGQDTKMFWTFAPYLFKCLKKNNISDQKIIELILEWAKDGVSAGTESKKQFKEQEDYNQLHLKGLEKFNEENSRTWILNKNSNHISHIFTEQEAQHIATILINENKNNID